MGDTCQSFQDCSINGTVRVCFRGGSGDESFCGCSDWSGYVGDTCGSWTATTRYVLLASLCYMMYSLFLLFVAVRMGYSQYILYNEHMEKRTKSVNLVAFRQSNHAKANVRLVTFMGVCAVVLVVAKSILNVISVLYPTESRIVVYSSLLLPNREGINSRLDVAVNTLSLLARLLQLLSLLFVIESWLHVLESIDKYIPDVHVMLSMHRLHQIIGILIPFSLALTLFLLLLGYFTDAMIFIIVIAISETILFIFVHKRFVCKLTRFTESNSQFQETRHMIDQSSNVFVVYLIGLVSFYTFNLVGIVWIVDKIAINGFNYLLVVRDVGGALTLIGLTYFFWYAHCLSNNLYSKRRGWLFYTKKSKKSTASPNIHHFSSRIHQYELGG